MNTIKQIQLNRKASSIEEDKEGHLAREMKIEEEGARSSANGHSHYVNEGKSAIHSPATEGSNVHSERTETSAGADLNSSGSSSRSNRKPGGYSADCSSLSNFSQDSTSDSASDGKPQDGTNQAGSETPPKKITGMKSSSLCASVKSVKFKQKGDDDISLPSNDDSRHLNTLDLDMGMVTQTSLRANEVETGNHQIIQINKQQASLQAQNQAFDTRDAIINLSSANVVHDGNHNRENRRALDAGASKRRGINEERANKSPKNNDADDLMSGYSQLLSSCKPFFDRPFNAPKPAPPLNKPSQDDVAEHSLSENSDTSSMAVLARPSRNKNQPHKGKKLRENSSNASSSSSFTSKQNEEQRRLIQRSNVVLRKNERHQSENYAPDMIMYINQQIRQQQDRIVRHINQEPTVVTGSGTGSGTGGSGQGSRNGSGTGSGTGSGGGSRTGSGTGSGAGSGGGSAEGSGTGSLAGSGTGTGAANDRLFISKKVQVPTNSDQCRSAESKDGPRKIPLHEELRLSKPAFADVIEKLFVDQRIHESEDSTQERLVSKKRKRMDKRREYEKEVKRQVQSSSDSSVERLKLFPPGLYVSMEDSLAFTSVASLIVQSEAPYLVVHVNAAFSRLSGIQNVTIIGCPLSKGIALAHSTEEGQQDQEPLTKPIKRSTPTEASITVSHENAAQTGVLNANQEKEDSTVETILGSKKFGIYYRVNYLDLKNETESFGSNSKNSSISSKDIPRNPTPCYMSICPVRDSPQKAPAKHHSSTSDWPGATQSRRARKNTSPTHFVVQLVPAEKCQGSGETENDKFPSNIGGGDRGDPSGGGSESSSSLSSPSSDPVVACG